MTGEPGPENDYQGEQAELILSSLARIAGRQLVDPGLSGRDRYQALYEASCCVVSHDTQADPIFNYGNQAALQLFEMNWAEFTRLPSRLSAEQPLREERERLLARVAEHGFIDDYKGVRVSATGSRFLVEDAIVWNLIDEHGSNRGQAAVLYKWSKL